MLLARFARAGGESLFKVYCSQCHGTGATGAEGYPNLNDDEWIWGGTIEEIAVWSRLGDEERRAVCEQARRRNQSRKHSNSSSEV